MTVAADRDRPAAVREAREPGPVPLHPHPGWRDRFPWLVQGTTGRGEEAEPFDLGLFGSEPSRTVLGRWRALRQATRCTRAVHARQVHAATVLRHEPGPPGVAILDDADGHVTDGPGVLLTVSIADCVPIFVVDPGRRAVALLHGGWRGVAAGILEAGIAALRAATGTEPADLHLHLGPAICGRCYEVGPEVHDALGLPRPGGPAPVDLRAVLLRRARELGVSVACTSVSERCTRCEPGHFFSHRAGAAGRQLGVIGIRPDPDPSVR